MAMLFVIKFIAEILVYFVTRWQLYWVKYVEVARLNITVDSESEIFCEKRVISCAKQVD